MPTGSSDSVTAYAQAADLRLTKRSPFTRNSGRGCEIPELCRVGHHAPGKIPPGHLVVKHHPAKEQDPHLLAAMTASQLSPATKNPRKLPSDHTQTLLKSHQSPYQTFASSEISSSVFYRFHMTPSAGCALKGLAELVDGLACRSTEPLTGGL